MSGDRHPPPFIDVAHPANATVLRFLGVARPELAHATAAADVDRLVLGAHPDLVDHLWGLLGDEASGCACVVDGRSFPLLASPRSGVIFALAGGTSTLAFRLPQPELSEALAVPGYGEEYRYPSGPVRAAEIGDGWALVRRFGERNRAWCERALAHAEAAT
jgi:hypothetical protein